MVVEMEAIMEDEKQTKHAELADASDNVFNTLHDNRNDEKYKLTELKLDLEELESCYTPIVMSGGSYDLRPSATSNELELDYKSSHPTIIMACGARYKYACSNLVRTYFVNATTVHEQAYTLLTDVYTACLANLRPSTRLSKVYDAAVAVIKRKKPELVEKFSADCGAGIGYEFRIGSCVINARNPRVIRKGMVFNLTVGFKELSVDGNHSDIKSGQTGPNVFAVLLGDTVVVTDGEPTKLTNVKRAYKHVAQYSLGDDDSDDQEDAAMDDLDTRLPASRGITRDRLRDREDVSSVSRKMLESQQALAERKREAALAAVQKQRLEKGFNKSKVVDGKFCAYQNAGDYPGQLANDKIYVDSVAEAILCPIAGELVPFHIRTLKIPTKSENQQQGTTELRLGFYIPVLSGATKSQVPAFADMNTNFVRELSYRTTGTSLNHIFTQIKDLRKLYTDRQKADAEAKSLVTQVELKVDRQQGAIAKMPGVFIRPVITTGRKKSAGVLSAHLNGFRYEAHDRTRVDVIYDNIHSCFYQPADNKNPNVLLHFKLVHPILVGKKKKKTDWLQFYVEVMEQTHDLNRGYRDEGDSLREAQQERENRRKWNGRFKEFAKKLQVHSRKIGSDLEFEAPSRKLAFAGKSNRQIVDHYPTISGHSLMALDDEPPLVVALRAVEVAVFERTHMGLKSFDLTFITKKMDQKSKLQFTNTRIEAIDHRKMDTIRQWLNESSIVFYELKTNVNWKDTFEDVYKDPQGFYEDGGWANLQDEGSEDEQNFDESESDYAPSGAEEEQSESSEYTSDEEESDEEDWKSGSGEDWEELEDNAKKSDAARRQKDREDEVEQPKRKRKAGGDSSSVTRKKVRR
jgi:nucleosome binding factor SPN SPT16 subunit